MITIWKDYVRILALYIYASIQISFKQQFFSSIQLLFHNVSGELFVGEDFFPCKIIRLSSVLDKIYSLDDSIILLETAPLVQAM